MHTPPPKKNIHLRLFGRRVFFKKMQIFTLSTRKQILAVYCTQVGLQLFKSMEIQMHCRLYRPFLGLFYGTLSIFMAERWTFGYRLSHVFLKLFIKGPIKEISRKDLGFLLFVICYNSANQFYPRSDTLSSPR